MNLKRKPTIAGKSSRYKSKLARSDIDDDTDNSLLSYTIENMRNKYKIPEKYKGFIGTDHHVDERMIQLLKDNPNNFRINYRESKRDLKVTGIIDMVEITYEEHKIYYALDEQDHDFMHIIFAENIDIIQNFFEDVLFDEEIEVPLLEPGFYKWEKTMVGMFLSPMKISKENIPVLNNDLNQVLQTEIKTFLAKEDFYKKNNLSYKRGFLLYGPPGNGKTSFIKTMDIKDALVIMVGANERDYIDESLDLISSNKYQDVLKIIIIEDIDGLDEHNRSLLLNVLDGVTDTYKTIFIATTNHPENLDNAFIKRPSRFDSIYNIDLPNEETRKGIIKHYFKDITDESVLNAAASATKDFSGAYIKELFLLSEYNDIHIQDAIILMKKKFEAYESFTSKDGNYMG